MTPGTPLSVAKVGPSPKPPRDCRRLPASFGPRRRVQPFLHDTATGDPRLAARPQSGFRALIGDSLGAARLLLQGDLDGAVHFPAARSHFHVEGPHRTRPSPMERSWWRRTCRSPTASQTGYLEHGRTRRSSSLVARETQTKLTLTQHAGAHPDDWGYSQDVMFDHAMLCIKQAAADGPASGQRVDRRVDKQVDKRQAT